MFIRGAIHFKLPTGSSRTGFVIGVGALFGDALAHNSKTA